MCIFDDNLHCRMYPADKVAISQQLVTLGFPQCDHTVGKLVHCVVKGSRPPDLNQVILKCQSPICLDYRARK